MIKIVLEDEWRARWDLNPGFPAPQADALSVLDYEPTNFPYKQKGQNSKYFA